MEISIPSPVNFGSLLLKFIRNRMHAELLIIRQKAGLNCAERARLFGRVWYRKMNYGRFERRVVVARIINLVFKAILVVGGAILLAILAQNKPTEAAEIKISYNRVMLVEGESTIEKLTFFDTEKIGKRTYNIYKDGSVVASVKFTKNGVLKRITLNEEFLNGILLKENAPRYSYFGVDLKEMGIADCNSLLTGSRTPDYSEMNVKNGNTKLTWNYNLYRKEGNLEGKVYSCTYHEDSWYVTVIY